MLRATGILLKKEAHAFFSSFTRKQRTPDVAGKLLSFLLAAAIVAFGLFSAETFCGHVSHDRGRESVRPLRPALRAYRSHLLRSS